jgi:hypothetical protein
MTVQQIRELAEEYGTSYAADMLLDWEREDGRNQATGDLWAEIHRLAAAES